MTSAPVGLTRVPSPLTHSSPLHAGPDLSAPGTRLAGPLLLLLPEVAALTFAAWADGSPVRNAVRVSGLVVGTQVSPQARVSLGHSRVGGIVFLAVSAALVAGSWHGHASPRPDARAPG